MEEGDEYRRRTLELLRDKCGFSFKEEDLSPSIRNEIVLLSYRLFEMDNFSLDPETKNKIGVNKRLSSYILYLVSAAFLIYGVLLRYGSILPNLALIIVSVIFIQLGYLLHLSRKHDLKKFVADSLESPRNAWDSDLKSLSNKIVDELNKSHNVRPLMKTLQCPSCGKDMPNNSLFCPYCATKLGIEKSRSDEEIF
ncbi:MAG: zinc-ribbon domain-containing protein [Nitrososphaeria archaeon]|jgi:hypothetical protein